MQAIHMAGSAAVMGPPGAFATRRWLHLFCSLVALTVVSINAYFLVLFRRDNLPAGAGALREDPCAVLCCAVLRCRLCTDFARLR